MSRQRLVGLALTGPSAPSMAQPLSVNANGGSFGAGRREVAIWPGLELAKLVEASHSCMPPAAQ
jgi:hypothetical protein